MPNRFADKEIRIIVVGTSSSIRQVITSVLKGFGYKRITGVGDIKSAIEVLETDFVDWVIAPVKDNHDGNILHILPIINDHPEIRHTKVSAYTDDVGHQAIPKAYEYGLFSHHAVELTIADMNREIENLLTSLEEHDGDFCLVAAAYLRDYLDRQQAYEELIALEKALLDVYPGNIECLVSLARSCFYHDEVEEGKIALHQLMLLDEDNAQAKEICEQFLGGSQLDSTDIAFASQQLGFNTAVVIDSNQKSLSVVYDLLKKAAGFKNVATFENPVRSLAWLRKNRNPDIILSEWQLPILPGPVFLYKLRKRLAIRAPLVLMNEAIAEREIPMVKELGAAVLL